MPYIQQQSGVNQTISGFTLALDANTVADITGAGNLTISSVISNASGSRSLIRDGTGAGILILNGNKPGAVTVEYNEAAKKPVGHFVPAEVAENAANNNTPQQIKLNA